MPIKKKKKKIRKRIVEVSYKDCACDAHDCEKCEALDDIIKSLTVEK